MHYAPHSTTGTFAWNELSASHPFSFSHVVPSVGRRPLSLPYLCCLYSTSRRPNVAGSLMHTRLTSSGCLDGLTLSLSFDLLPVFA
jgi:hypothetical protein